MTTEVRTEMFTLELGFLFIFIYDQFGLLDFGAYKMHEGVKHKSEENLRVPQQNRNFNFLPQFAFLSFILRYAPFGSSA